MVLSNHKAADLLQRFALFHVESSDFDFIIAPIFWHFVDGFGISVVIIWRFEVSWVLALHCTFYKGATAPGDPAAQEKPQSGSLEILATYPVLFHNGKVQKGAKGQIYRL